MEIKKLYGVSLFIGYLSFVISGIIMLIIKDTLLMKGIILFIVGGIFYTPVFAISNLPLFILLKNPKNRMTAFFSSIPIIGIVSFIGIQINIVDDFLWKLFLPAQLMVSLISFYYYRFIVN